MPATSPVRRPSPVTFCTSAPFTLAHPFSPTKEGGHKTGGYYDARIAFGCYFARLPSTLLPPGHVADLERSCDPVSLHG